MVEESTGEPCFVGQPVLLFEYCHGTSLEELLQLPTNRLGLPSDVILDLLADLSDALKYLNRKNIVHTEIRPDNIFQSTDVHGTRIFKLTDFRTARRARQRNHSVSLVAQRTMEPIQTNASRNPSKSLVRSSSLSNVELWSLGITLYQCITGHLPLQSFTGRPIDRVRLRRLWETKPLECLSGIEVCATGEIQWSKTLPECCRLPKTLKVVFEKLLSNMLEIDSDWLMTFDEFLDEVDHILDLIPVHYLIMHQCLASCDYFQASDSMDTFFEYMNRQINANPPLQYQIFFNYHWYPIVPSMTIKAFCDQLPLPQSRDHPLILYPASSATFNLNHWAFHVVPDLEWKIREPYDLTSLYQWSYELVALICHVKHSIEDLHYRLRAMVSGLQTVHRFLKSQVLTLLSSIRQKRADYQLIQEIDQIIPALESTSKSYPSQTDKQQSSTSVKGHRRHKSLVQPITDDSDFPSETASERFDHPILFKAIEFYQQLQRYDHTLTALLEDNLNYQWFCDRNARPNTKDRFLSSIECVDRYIDDATHLHEAFRRDMDPSETEDLKRSFYHLQQKRLESCYHRFTEFVRLDCDDLISEQYQWLSIKIKQQWNAYLDLQTIQTAYDNLTTTSIPIDHIRQAIDRHIRLKIPSERYSDARSSTPSRDERKQQLARSLYRSQKEEINSLRVVYINEDPLMDSIRMALRSAIEDATRNSTLLEQIKEILTVHATKVPLL